MKAMHKTRLFPQSVSWCLVFLACLNGAVSATDDQTAAGNWPAWRRDGAGISDEKDLPVEWSETENVVWRTPLPGEGNSSPIIWGTRVFVTAALDEGAKRLVLCLDTQSGKFLWKFDIGSPIHAAPVISREGQIYVSTVDGVLYTLG